MVASYWRLLGLRDALGGKAGDSGQPPRAPDAEESRTAGVRDGAASGVDRAHRGRHRHVARRDLSRVLQLIANDAAEERFELGLRQAALLDDIRA
jgi:hypothetical protein